MISLDTIFVEGSYHQYDGIRRLFYGDTFPILNCTRRLYYDVFLGTIDREKKLLVMCSDYKLNLSSLSLQLEEEIVIVH